ncbi:phage terminase large subunit [Bacteroides graminisolvens]|uniref:Terminase n=1 Tax=Bacteroides graminisolvens DSM 19988 = JCM 15093 TaxID=1121097 RepID=A0A069D6B6_9BACE|nr:phage terminase large subunit [Bacteroides graminisolvens]GAK37947.1 terminase [Bacteroides graminisolvens DSM 19988 = JCM 15093]
MVMKQTKREILIRKAEAAIILRKREARNNFWAYCLYMDPKFFAKRPFLRLVAEAFMRVFVAYSNNVIYRLAVSMPPRAGKSYITSLFISWMFGHFPEESVMRNTCADPLYNKLSYDTRDIIRSRKYKEVFPEIKLRSDKQNVHGWSLEKARQVSYFGAGVGGTVIGFGASMLAVTDDLYKSLEDALSDNNNEKTWSWKQGTHDSRIEGNCCSIDIGTRWSANDVLGRLEESRDGKYYDEIIRIPALDENDKSFCEDVHTTQYYHELRAETDDAIWAAEYMQEPYEAKGLLFPKSGLKRFKLADVKGRQPDGRIGATDVADEGDDYFSSPFADVFGTELYITDVLFTKDAVEITMPRLSQMILDTGCDQMRIESNNGGRIFSISVRKEVQAKDGKCIIQARPTTKNKETRILMKSGWVKAHCHFLDETEYAKGSDYWWFMKYLTSYKKEGGNEHDDAPDSLTILAEFFESLAGNIKGEQKRKVARGTGIR